MNSLILISPDQGSGFKPILSGKRPNSCARRLEPVVHASVARSKSPNHCVMWILRVEATVAIQGETLHWENAASFAVSACGLVARPTYKQKIALSSIPNCAIIGISA
jgi:hypothetical protein